MLVTIKKYKTVEAQEVIEVKLPAYYKDPQYLDYYMISENKHVINFYIGKDDAYASMYVDKNQVVDRIEEIVSVYNPITPYEFFRAQDRALQILQSSILKPTL
jgi:hypothetical protein